MRYNELELIIRKLGKGRCEIIVDRGKGGHKLVVCTGGCRTIIQSGTRGEVKPGTLKKIEKALEPCLGKRWLGDRR